MNLKAVNHDEIKAKPKEDDGDIINVLQVELCHLSFINDQIRFRTHEEE